MTYYRNVRAHEVHAKIIAHHVNDLAQPVIYSGSLSDTLEYARSYFDRNYEAWANVSSLHVLLTNGDVLASYLPASRDAHTNGLRDGDQSKAIAAIKTAYDKQ